MNGELDVARAVLEFAEDAYAQFDAGLVSSIKSLGISRSDGLIAQLAYFAHARKAAKKLIADAQAKLDAVEKRHADGRR